MTSSQGPNNPKTANTLGNPGTTVPGVYARLGVKPIINAGSWLTALGGSLMAPEVMRAMQEASTSFVDLRALQSAAGEILARACVLRPGW